MNDCAAARCDHAWQEAAIEPDRGEQIGVEFSEPVGLAQGGEAAGWCGGASEVVHEDVDAAHAIECFGDGGVPTPSAEVRSAAMNSSGSTSCGWLRAVTSTIAPAAASRRATALRWVESSMPLLVLCTDGIPEVVSSL
jgi:hypothetical protein